MKCQNCGDEIPDFPEEKVEENLLDEVVGHKHGFDKESPAITTKDYYCDPECFVEAFAQGESPQ